MRCDKKVVSGSAPQRARNEHKEVEALRRETVLSDNNLSRSYTGGAGVLERFFSLEGACGRKERIKRSCIPGSKTVCQTVHTCVSGVNVQERSVRGELIVKRLSTGRVQIVHWRVPTVNERNRGGPPRGGRRCAEKSRRWCVHEVSSDASEPIREVHESL